MELIREWWAVIWALLLTVVSLVQFLLSKTYARRDDLESLTMTVDQLSKRVSELPDRHETHELQLEISELRGDLKALKEQLKPVQHLAQLMLEDRLKGG